MNETKCGCGKEATEQYDYHGIYAGKMCDKCFGEKYVQDDYTLYSDENIDDDY